MTEQTPTPISQRSPLLRFFRRLFTWSGIRRKLILLAWCFTAIALLYAEEHWRGRRAWDNYRREMEFQGKQLELKALIPKPVPDDQNFASTPFVKSWFTWRTNSDAHWGDNFTRISQTVASGRGRNEPVGRQFVDLVAWDQAFANFESTAQSKSGKLKSKQLDPEARAKAAPAILTGLKTSEPLLIELRNASQRPLVQYPVFFDLENPWGILLLHLDNIKSGCQRLKLKACAELALGHPDQALADVKLMLYLADSLKDEPFLMSHLVRMGCVQTAIQPIWEGLTEHRWSESQLQWLQTSLQSYNFLSDLKHPMETERAAGILTVDLIRRKGLGHLRTLENEPAPSTLIGALASALVPSGWYYQEKLNYCKLYEAQLAETIDAGNKRVRPSQVESNEQELARAISGGPLGRPLGLVLHHRVIAGLLLPALGKTVQRSAQGQTTTEEAALACALERYRLAQNRFPEKLEKLVPAFSPQLPKDVITGKPYKYRTAGETGYVLYSIGWNEKDDFGVPGKTMFDEKHGDWVWELPGS